MDYAAAVAELYQSPHAQFVAERKRLAAALKPADKAGAAKLAKLGRPPISAWAVNQLYWHARDAFDRLLETAQRLRAGDLSANAAHRDALTKLRQRAAAILGDAGHNASEGTLRRVAQTLSAIAATGSFDPDPPGALADDRDPPGFEAAGLIAGLAPPAATVPDEVIEEEEDDDGEVEEDDDDSDADERAAAAELLRAAATQTQAEQRDRKRADAERAEAKRVEAERAEAKRAEAKRAAERKELETELATARAEVTTKQRLITKLEHDLVAARDQLANAEAAVETFENDLAALDPDDEVVI